MDFLEALFGIFFTPENWSVEYILSAVSILLVAVGGFFSYGQWDKANKTKRAEFIKEILTQLRFDQEMSRVVKMIDYEDGWYGAEFHNGEKELEDSVDKLLSYLSYVCYLKEEGHLTDKEFGILRYELIRVCNSRDIQSYLWNLYHFSKSQGTECSFRYLIDYGEKNGLFASDFYSSSCSSYPQMLNF